MIVNFNFINTFTYLVLGSERVIRYELTDLIVVIQFSEANEDLCLYSPLKIDFSIVFDYLPTVICKITL